MSKTMKVATLALAVILWTCASVSWARTWHVAQDGTGDFTVIQAAVDAASDGDVIHIHAGRYSDYIDNYDVWHDGTTMHSRVHVAVTKDNLTLQGDGPGETVIGPEELTGIEGYYYGIVVTYLDCDMLTIRDLSLENMEDGIFGANRELLVEHCRFNDLAHDGMDLHTSNGARILDSEFVDLIYTGSAGIGSFSSAGMVEVSRCSFYDGGGIVFAGDGGTVNDCVFIDGNTSINFQQGAVGTVANCSMTNPSNFGLVVFSGAHMEFSNCIISGGASGLWVRDGNASAVGEDCVFSGHTWTTFYLSQGSLELHNSEILNGGGWSVLCEGGMVDPYSADLSNNYWGADSADQIAAWIWDHEDDPGLACTVNFEPFQGPIPVQSHTWTEVKELFRD